MKQLQRSNNQGMLGLKQRVKCALLPPGLLPRQVRFGLLKGLRMDIDFAHDTQLWLGLYERELHGWFHKLSQGISTAIDVGANAGSYTLYFLARTPARKVLAFEPDGEALSILRKNLALNRLSSDGRLEIIPRVVSSYADQNNVILDSYAKRVISPCLVKIDAEGGEVVALSGARQLFSLPGIRWIVETHAPQLEEECVRIFREAGYRTALVPNAWWRFAVPEYRPGQQNRWLIAVREKTSSEIPSFRGR